MSMALSAALRRAMSAAASVASRRNHLSSASVFRPRALCGSNQNNGVFVNSLSVRTPLVALARYSSSQAKDLEALGSDSDIIEAINKEINTTEEAHVNQVKALRDGFNFEIYDEEGSEFITLRRKFGNETIEIEVYLEDANDDDYEDIVIDETTTSSSSSTTSSSSTSENEEEEGAKKNIVLKDAKDGEEEVAEDLDIEEETKLAFRVTVSKGEGRKLVFSCIGDYVDFKIEDLYFDVKKDKEGEEAIEDSRLTFNDLSWDLQKGFYKYLERRSISPSTLGFLQDYMLNKKRRDYLEWLNNMKQFIEN